MTEQEEYQIENEKIHAKPYEFICEYVESIYPKIGRKTFEVLSLMPVSIIIPDLSFGNKTVRSNLHALFLAASGSGKTSIAKLFASLTYSPIELESVTAAGLESAISQSPIFSLIVGDFARMSRDPVLIKVIEGLLGEEKRISRKTMRKEIDLDVEGSALLCGVSSDLSHYIMSGIVWRVIPILVGHNYTEHSEIGEHIKNKIGVEEFSDNERVIKEYYMELAEIQTGKHNKIHAVRGYKISKSFRDRAYDEWNKLTQPIVKDCGLAFFRELQEFFRILVAHAFLNVFQRKVDDGILVPTEEDFNVALKLMRRSILFKFRLIRSEGFAKGIKNAKEFKRIMQSDKIPEHYKEIIRNLVEIKGDRVVQR